MSVQAVREREREREGFDRVLLIITIALLLVGTILVLDASSPRALHTKNLGNDPWYFFKRQCMWAVVALGAMVGAMHFPYWKLRDWRFWLGGVAISAILLVLVLLVAKEINGSKRWLALGPLTFQPSELAKVSLILFLARYGELWKNRISHFKKGFLPPVLVVFLLGGLVAKEDLGTAIVVFGTGLLMIFMMGARPVHMAMLLGAAFASGVLLIAVESYRMKRIVAWIDLIVHPLVAHQGDAYQPFQALLAIGSGGIWGKGWGHGTAKYLYLPAEYTDYIFATVGEEGGLFACLALVGAFAWLVVRGLTVAHRTSDWFGSLLAAGLTSMIGLQALLNIAVVLSLAPSTGVPLPFISYGGSSLVITAVAVGIILNISAHPAGAAGAAKGKETREGRPDGWRHRRPHLSST